MSRKFFEERSDQSAVKAAIVAKYFWAWANVIKGAAKKRGSNIAYIDLFAGPGRYKDGAASTPLLILEQAIEDDDLREMLVCMFNDMNSDHSNSLEVEIAKLPGIKRLKHKPDVYSDEVGTEIVEHFESMRLVPTLFFVDPYGYKGLSLRLINSVLRNWGCDCIFFFNYNRINMGLPNKFVVEPLNELFGLERAAELRERVSGMTPLHRELAIVEAIGEALQDMGGKYVLPFCFKRPDGARTSHHLIFVSKNQRGYDIMKEIMAKESSTIEQDVPTFEYNPAYRDQGLLFELSRPLDDLGPMLLKEFSGRTMSLLEVFDSHNYGRRFIKRNYKSKLTNMELEGLVTCDPPANKRRPRNGQPTFADHTSITFPSRMKRHGSVKH